MIFDHLENAGNYANLHPLFRKAFDYLGSQDFSSVPNGQYEIDGTRLFAIVNSYETEPAEMRFWEGHKKYIDIQYIVSGKERMGVARRSQMTETQAYDVEKDFSKFEGRGDEIEVRPGYFTVFFPADVHMPNLAAGTPEQVKKVVLKVQVSEPVMRLCFASNNAHKLEEIRAKLEGSGIELVSLAESGMHENLPEHGTTLEENAYQKASQVYSTLGINCFADDTGLEVEALGGAPGVYSARYAGETATAEDNVRKLLQAMQDESNRKARFRTVISLVLGSLEFRFDGVIHGTIAREPRGTHGFGYDPVFIPDGYKETFAEMSMQIKNNISHRALAVDKLVRFLKEKVLES